ncbi:hypothetical protein EDL79_02130 [Ehrlichia ruminantium]|uniref:DUF3168 domain-containing protein n=1 Tax=Ehrlichia ruminantium TaxID=779 RepID=A0AAE6QB86_EHRRU|nr:hypothetical protein [Ehrlichia ruminantium]QGR03381.1 hypothetical protein EDL80_02130 [Ehrlichia ruminantium]QGR04308.1 hypothetical protein EDL79_02130 [Ehrlichia ruminantium]
MIDSTQIIYNSVLKLLKSHRDLSKIITNIYDITPNKVSLPYVNVQINNLKTLTTFNKNILKVQILCNVYSNHLDTLYEVSSIIINKLVNYQVNSPKFEYKIIPEYSSNINQNKESIHALLIFTVLAKENHVNTIAN